MEYRLLLCRTQALSSAERETVQEQIGNVLTTREDAGNGESFVLLIHSCGCITDSRVPSSVKNLPHPPNL